MSKKQLQVEGIMNELEGASLFFNKSPSLPLSNSPVVVPVPTESTASPPIPEIPHPQPVEPIVTKSTVLAKNIINNQDSVQKDHNVSGLASKQASTHNTKTNDPVEAIRKTVKQMGKEVLFIRVTPDEKHELGSIVYAFNEMYRGEGRKTSENEIGRIGLNFLLQDYQENGNNSILARVLAALNA